MVYISVIITHTLLYWQPKKQRSTTSLSLTLQTIISQKLDEDNILAQGIIWEIAVNQLLIFIEKFLPLPGYELGTTPVPS